MVSEFLSVTGTVLIQPGPSNRLFKFNRGVATGQEKVSANFAGASPQCCVNNRCLEMMAVLQSFPTQKLRFTKLPSQNIIQFQRNTDLIFEVQFVCFFRFLRK